MFGDFFKSTIKKVNDAKERHEQYKEEMLGKSDDQLFEISVNDRSDKPLRAGCALKELQARGWEMEDIQARRKKMIFGS